MKFQCNDGTSLHLDRGSNVSVNDNQHHSLQFTYIVDPVTSQPVKALEHKQCRDDTDKADIEVVVECSQENERLQHRIPAVLNQMLMGGRGMGIRQSRMEWRRAIVLLFSGQTVLLKGSVSTNQTPNQLREITLCIYSGALA